MQPATYNWIIPGKQVWFKQQETFVSGQVTARDEGKSTATCRSSVSDQAVNVSFQEIYQCATVQKDYDDMCNMDVLNEPEILSNIKRRYAQDKIFTKIGPTLIVVNPYKVIDSLFNQQKMKDLTHKVKASEKIDNLDPHVFLIAGTAYNRLRIGNKKQAIVISGQSGAGKTENAKYCMAFLTGLSHEHHSNQKKVAIEDKILECNPVLEAFGNSKTVRNSNSSRFGKYVRLYLDGMCSIRGARIESYLLEKSRVVHVAQQQRNFHIFYCLFHHPSKTKYGLQDGQKFELLQMSGCPTAEGLDDKQNFEEVHEALQKVGFSTEQIDRIWKTVASILLLGNVRFDDTAHHKDVSKSCTYQDKSIVERVGNLLNLKNIEQVLVQRKVMHGKEEILSKMNKAQCQNNKNTLSKALYNRLFDYLIDKMNERLSVKEEGFNSIGLLDIFGFENFLVNSFQQLCINFANEKLQKLYTRYVFETELDEIKKDGLGDRVKDITPPDNQAIITLMEKKPGVVSVFSLIDDKTSMAMSKEEDIVVELKREYVDKKKSPHILIANNSKNTFTIVHTQSNVTYTIDGFKIKNEDKVTPEIDAILDNSFQIPKITNVKGKTIAFKFDTEVKTLMGELESSEVHFIRCIKPNEQKVKQKLDEVYTLKQIRYLGVLETIKIRKSTFPYRKPFKQFNEICCQVIVKNDKLKTDAEKAQYYLKQIFPEIEKAQNAYLVGNERIYICGEYESKLNEFMLTKFKKKQEASAKIQKQWKVFKMRKRILNALKILVTKVRKVKKLTLKKLQMLKKLYFKKFRDQAALATKAFKERKRLEEERKRQQQQRKRQEDRKKKEEEAKKQKEKELEAKAAATKNDKVNKAKKFEPHSAKFIKILLKYQRFLFFTKLKYYKKESALNETVIMDQSVMYDSVTSNAEREKLKKMQQQAERQKREKKEKMQEEMQFNQSFLNEKSVLIDKTVFVDDGNQNAAIKGQLKVGRYVKHSGVKKLREIIDQVYKPDQVDQDQFYSPPSIDCNFDINQLDSDVVNKIVNFDYISFFDTTLRVRKTLFGRQKSCSETLIAKDAPITKSLILLTPEEEKKSVECFRLLLLLSQEQRIEKVFKLVQQIIESLQDSSQLLKNQVFTQFIKQQNTKSQLSAIRVFQMMTIYIHVFKPDDSFIYSALNIFYSKLTSSGHKKQNQYLQYLFPRMMKLIEPNYENNVSYLPAQYQMMALMCKRQISMPIFFSVGNSIIVRIESYQTFSDIKEQVLKDVGINPARLHKDLFGFFEIMNFENEQLQESPIDDNRNVWDLLTYWERAKERFEQNKIKPPLFIMMLKIKYAFECDHLDEQSIELCYAQCYFDLFIGRIKIELPDIVCAIAALKLINEEKLQDGDISSLIPMWVTQKHTTEDITKRVKTKSKDLQSERMSVSGLKYFFVRMCDKSKLCMAMAVPTQQQVQLFLRPKRIILAEKGNIHEEISIKKILKWSVDEETLMLSVQKEGDTRTMVIRTQYAQIVSKYLALSAKLIMRKIQ